MAARKSLYFVTNEYFHERNVLVFQTIFAALSSQIVSWAAEGHLICHDHSTLGWKIVPFVQKIFSLLLFRLKSPIKLLGAKFKCSKLANKKRENIWHLSRIKLSVTLRDFFCPCNDRWPIDPILSIPIKNDTWSANLASPSSYCPAEVCGRRMQAVEPFDARILTVRNLYWSNSFQTLSK